MTDIKPEVERRMDHTSHHLTLCQILREIYWKTDDPEIKWKCRLGTTMAKAMAKKISKLDPNWGKDYWPWRREFYYEHRWDDLEEVPCEEE